VTRVELSLAASERLDRMIVTHSLPTNTRLRIGRSLLTLARFPSIGRQLEGEWSGFRFIVGPWRWLLIVYLYDDAAEQVLVVNFQDARSSGAVTNLARAR
jgi:plasmid stabilization system protein ParE